MTAHQLAQYLMRCPDLPVFINGWGSDEGGAGFEVTGGTIADDCGVKHIALMSDDPKDWVNAQPADQPKE